MARDYPNVTMLPVFIEGRSTQAFLCPAPSIPVFTGRPVVCKFHSKRFWPYRVRLLSPVPVTNAREVQAYVES